MTAPPPVLTYENSRKLDKTNNLHFFYLLRLLYYRSTNADIVTMHKTTLDLLKMETLLVCSVEE